MPKYKIGITEAGDAGLDLSWANKLDTVDGCDCNYEVHHSRFL